MSSLVSEPETYFRSLVPSRDGLILQLEAEAERDKIPIVGPLVGELLFVLARVTNATRILEFGTAIGYSTIYLARGCNPGRARVLTLEKDPDMAARARENFVRAGVESRVELRTGDALQEAASLTESFDMIFLDIEKSDYIKTLKDCRRLLRTGGLLVADNVAFRDADPFNRAIVRDPGFRSVPLFGFLPEHSPEHDGILLALKL